MLYFVTAKLNRMDFVVSVIRKSIPLLLLSIGGIAVLKAYLMSQVKRFDIAELFFSFFRLYNTDERSLSSNKKRIAYMRWNNLLNYYVYLVVGISLLIYLVTRNA
jgi:hypothetical protein